MRTISAELKAHLAGDALTLATCWKVTRRDSTVLGFTDHDQDIVFDAVTYRSINGYTTSALSSGAQMDVDALEAKGPQLAPGMTSQDIRAGLWDFAQISLFQVNWADLTMGALHLRDGWTGQLSTGRGDFTAELRGLMQAYSRSIGRLIVPACDANLGDARCTVNLAPFTVTSTLTGVNLDNITLYDTARTEPGPSGGIAITGITNANPGVVTVANAATLADGMVVTLSEIVGPALLNQVTIVRGLSGNTFQLSVDTSDTAAYPPYVSGGVVTPSGAESGYFDDGVIAFTSGANSGFSMEIRAYVPGQMTLFAPMPYQAAIGDAYTMHAGCDKTKETCKNRFSNIVNHRGFPFLPGVDKMVQVGRSQ